jgi:hypothetical protein
MDFRRVTEGIMENARLIDLIDRITQMSWVELENKDMAKQKEIDAQNADIKENMDKAKLEEANAEKTGDLTRVSQIRYGTLTELQKNLEEKSRKLESVQKDQKMLLLQDLATEYLE